MRAGSTTERALHLALQASQEAGAQSMIFGGPFLARLPIYSPETPGRSDEQHEFLEAVRTADGVIVATPGYHGGVSGLVKNALDLLEDLRGDKRCYLDGRAVGCIVTAFGWQTCGTTLIALRSIIHALRGWPTPLGAVLNTADSIFDPVGACKDAKAALQLAIVGQQVVEFAMRFGAAGKSVTSGD
jgi:FMN reductase